MNDLMVFEGSNVEIFELNGQVLFNPKHVAEILDIADVKSSIRGFSEKQVVKIKNSDVHNMHFRKLNNAGENFLTESGAINRMLKNSQIGSLMKCFLNYVKQDIMRCREKLRKCMRKAYRQ